MIAHYQVYVSRSEWMLEPNFQGKLGPATKLHANQEDCIVSWAALHALIEHHFEYSRGAIEATPSRLDTSRIHTALWKDLISLTHNPGLTQSISKRIERYGDGHVDKFELY